MMTDEKNFSQNEKLSNVPEWDLTHLYSGPDSKQLQRDILFLEAEIKSFAEQWQGNLAGLTGDELAEAIIQYEKIDEALTKITSFGQLLFAKQTTDPNIASFYQSLSETITRISVPILFFVLELNRIEDSVITKQLASSSMERWRPFIRDIRVFCPYQLSDDVERLLHEKSVTGSQAWCRLFDETIAGLVVDYKGQSTSLNIVLEKLSDPDRKERACAAAAVSQGLQSRIGLFSLITNVLAKDKQIVDDRRGYRDSASSRHLGNMVEDNVVDALVTAVTDSYPKLSHRYYTLKAKWLGLETLQHWDRNAPLPGADDSLIQWEQAKDKVLQAYSHFDRQLGDIAKDFFDYSWIDAKVTPGKSPGAFSHPVVPSSHPYILLNYYGKIRDVMTLAHELGHGIHQVLASERGHILSQTPLILAETASVFGEMLTFQSLLEDCHDRGQKRLILAAKVEDMLNTVVRQIAFYQFEQRIHSQRKKGEILPEKIGEIWRSVQMESLGPIFTFTSDYDLYWAYIPHFIHSPFYVYAYAFGDCLVNTLYGIYFDGYPDFQNLYKSMLSAGGTLRHSELLQPFGLDACDPAFWHRGLRVISGLIDQLESDDI